MFSLKSDASLIDWKKDDFPFENDTRIEKKNGFNRETWTGVEYRNKNCCSTWQSTVLPDHLRIERTSRTTPKSWPGFCSTNSPSKQFIICILYFLTWPSLQSQKPTTTSEKKNQQDGRKMHALLGTVGRYVAVDRIAYQRRRMLQPYSLHVTVFLRNSSRFGRFGGEQTRSIEICSFVAAL